MEISQEFNRYVAHLSEGLGHADRHAGLSGYCTGLMLPLSRKSVEPMAARMDPLHASARHQALLHFVAKSEWSDQAVMARVRDWVVPALGLGSGCYWIIDDTGFPKKGKHSVGVARQHCGQLGKQDNCQVAVSLSLASAQGSLPIAYQLYLPKDWAADPVRRKAAGVPETQAFATKPEIALAQMRQAIAAGVPMGVVLADAGYGDETAFRDGITELGMLYAAAFARPPRYGRRGLRRWRPKSGRVVAYGPRGCVGSPAMSRWQSRRWPWRWRHKPGAASLGGRAATTNSAGVSPRCGCVLRTGTILRPRCALSSGC